MAELNGLIDCVNRNDHTNFLRIYLQQVLTDSTLEYPLTRDRDGIYLAWEDIVTHIEPAATQEFIKRLSMYWIKAVERYNGPVNEKFPKQILDIIENRQTQRRVISRHERYTVDVDSVSPDISTNYYKESNARLSPLKSSEEIQKQAGRALRKKDVTHFLLYYLSLSRLDNGIEVPLTTVFIASILSTPQ
ncbi:hypothetical protein ACFL96_18725, partial [Thermoproteota archaeon]